MWLLGQLLYLPLAAYTIECFEKITGKIKCQIFEKDLFKYRVFTNH